MSGRVLAWFGGGVVVMAAAGLGVYLGVAGLSNASELAGVVGGFVGLAGLGVAAFGVVQAHADAIRSAPNDSDGAQSVSGTTAGTVTQVKEVTGNVSIGKSLPAASSSPTVLSRPQVSLAPPIAPPGPTAGGGQFVEGSNVTGDVFQVDRVGGDLDIG